ncbi:hypothetical protein EI555_019067 [Monodon monoceros]|uniref:Uncharacterized protein n=1 Tax=Monodon monoceros TaxID=40151 RepID=A0A4U1EM28_MONMO|nr:hypothetical protein EI555_019067 [Monodon monoceros]
MNQSLADPRSPPPSPHHRGPVTQPPRGATSLPKAPPTAPSSPSPTPPPVTPPPGTRGLRADNNRKRQLAPPSGSAGHFRSPSSREPERCARAGVGFGGGGNTANGQHGAVRGQRILTWFPLRLKLIPADVSSVTLQTEASTAEASNSGLCHGIVFFSWPWTLWISSEP